MEAGTVGIQLLRIAIWDAASECGFTTKSQQIEDELPFTPLAHQVGVGIDEGVSGPSCTF